MGLEKVYVGWEMSTRWTDPPMILMGLQLAFVPAMIWMNIYLTLNGMFHFVPILNGAVWAYWNFVHHAAEQCDSDKFLEWHDAGMKKTWHNVKVPISILWEAFMDGKVSFKGDLFVLLEQHRYEFCNFRLTWNLIKFLYAQFLPQTSSSFKDKKATKKEIAEHYDRGNDFFACFLGPRMVYTSAIFKDLNETLEKAQDNKMDMVCDKLHVKKGDRFLDIGCGWGTLARHAAKKYGAEASAVTLSVEGGQWCRDQNKADGLTEKQSKVLVCDYRDIPDVTEADRFNAISSIEMAEHVGLANFQVYLKKVKTCLKDDGQFLMQVAGLRQGSNWEDVNWGLFMSKYIFPGADASTPLNWYVKQCELAGFEVHSVETIGRHYSHTLHRWYLNWLDNRKQMTDKYGDHLYRMMEFFLSWSAVASGFGTATCYQIVMNKNTNDFPRDVWCGDGKTTCPRNAKLSGISLTAK